MGSLPSRIYKRAAHFLAASPLGRLAAFARWTAPTAWEFLVAPRPKDQRLLIVYDLTTQPFSIGDILSYQAASLVLREQYGQDKVDFALVYDPEKPACADPAFSYINSDNVISHIGSVLAATQINPHHGSLFVFDSHKRFYSFLAHNGAQYRVWPTAPTFAEAKYLFYKIQNEIFHDYFQAHGTIPSLTCGPFLRQWAHQFVQKNIAPCVPVSVQLRNNPRFGAHRNSVIEAWLEFFQYCESRHPVRFILIGARTEIDERLRQHPNVIVAKDHGTTLEQDLALVDTSVMHLGASSGPCMLPIFSQKPFLLVNSDILPERYRGMTVTDGVYRFCFSGFHQKLATGAETAEMLVSEFEAMWASISTAQIPARQAG